MCILMQVLPLVALLLAISTKIRGEDICQRCECLPSLGSPTQAICRDNATPDKDFVPSTTQDSLSLELIYIYGIQTVNIKENSIVTEKPVTLLIQNCSSVSIAGGSVARLRTLLVKDADAVLVGALFRDDLWAVVLEDIKQLTVSSASLSANYSVSIRHINALSLEGSDDNSCNSNPDLVFSMTESQVKPVPKGGLLLCGGNIAINHNTFESVAERGIEVITEGSITIENNNFENLTKLAFNLTSPTIQMTDNNFATFPAGVLRGVSTLDYTLFSNNTIVDIDLGGVLLDMGWDMVIEHNTIDCDCASKRTSILNPKQDLLYLSNSSLEKLKIIFHDNFCNLNCTVSLQTFSNALTKGTVCVTNSTRLEQDLLCDITTELETTESEIETTESEKTVSIDIVEQNINSNVYSAASRIEFLVPLVILVIASVLTSCYCGCKDMHTFKFTFRPNDPPNPKLSQ